MDPAAYESDALVAQYLLLHYGTRGQTVAHPQAPADALHFPERVVAQFAWDALAKPDRALDLGCAVGRSTFALARHCRSVLGIDRSEHFIAIARRLAEKGSLEFPVPTEGRHSETLTFRVPDDAPRGSVQFDVGDAMALDPQLEPCDAVLAANLICRLPDPAVCLRQMPRLVRPGGQLLITSPYTWMSEFTPREHWFGNRTGRSLDDLQRLLEPHFRLKQAIDLPFFIREHQRKFQWSLAEASLWIRMS